MCIKIHIGKNMSIKYDMTNADKVPMEKKLVEQKRPSFSYKH